MSATADLYFQLALEGGEATIGNKNSATELTLALGQTFLLDSVIVEDNYTVRTLWTSSAFPADYTWGVILSDKDLLVQFKNNKGTAEYQVVQVFANIPYFFGFSTRAGTSSFLTTTVQTTSLGSVSEIKAQNNIADAAGDATVIFALYR